jgi:hypothetical protein
MNPALMEMVAQAKSSERRSAAATRSARLWGAASAGASASDEIQAWTLRSGTDRSIAARRTIGWFLVRLGLRLALPRPGTASAR